MGNARLRGGLDLEKKAPAWRANATAVGGQRRSSGDSTTGRFTCTPYQMWVHQDANTFSPAREAHRKRLAVWAS
jgi:hypothetical protein